MLFIKTSEYVNKKWSHNKEFQVNSQPVQTVYQDMKTKALLYTLKALDLIPSAIKDKINYNSSKAITYVYANHLHRINGNLSSLTPEQILKLIKISKSELMSFWTYSLSINTTPSIYSITETLTIYTGFTPGSRIRVKKKITNYISVTHNKVDVMYFDKRDDVTKEIFEYFKNNYGVKTKNEFLMKLFEANGKLDEVKFYWKLKVNGEKKDTRVHETVYIWFEPPTK